MSELEQLRQEAENLKCQIRVSIDNLHDMYLYDTRTPLFLDIILFKFLHDRSLS